MLAAKADVNAKGDDGGTALVAASQRGYLEIVQKYLGFAEPVQYALKAWMIYN